MSAERQKQYEEFCALVREAIEGVEPPIELPTLLFLLCGTAARFAIVGSVPRRAFVIAALNAFDIAQRDFEHWRRTGEG